MRSRHPDTTAVGYTHASSVMPVVRWSEAESLMVTIELVPLNTRALLYLPAAVHVPLVIVPVFPLPDESATVVPVPSLNEYAATSPWAMTADGAQTKSSKLRTAERRQISWILVCIEGGAIIYEN